MAYRFKASDASITEGVRRIAAHEFGSIAAALADKSLPLGRKVHEGRKATKRLRAVLRLTAPVFPDAHVENAALREAAGRLSALRDKGALIETLGRIALPEDAAGRLNAAFGDRRSVSAAEQRRLLRAFGDEMRAASERAVEWSLEREGWRAIGPGLERCHHRFRKSLAAARQAHGDEPLHEFRKRAKDHWYQTLLLRGVFPDVMDSYGAAGEALCNDLGDWRDLGLLEAELRAVPVHILAKPDAEAAFALITKGRRRALRRAFRTAGRLGAETPEAYASRLKTWWRAPR